MATKFTFKPGALRKVRFSPEVRAELARRAQRVASAAGPGMVVRSGNGRTRARSSVVTTTTEARIAEAKHRTLTRAFGAARG